MLQWVGATLIILPLFAVICQMLVIQAQLEVSLVYRQRQYLQLAWLQHYLITETNRAKKSWVQFQTTYQSRLSGLESVFRRYQGLKIRRPLGAMCCAMQRDIVFYQLIDLTDEIDFQKSSNTQCGFKTSHGLQIEQPIIVVFDHQICFATAVPISNTHLMWRAQECTQVSKKKGEQLILQKIFRLNQTTIVLKANRHESLAGKLVLKEAQYTVQPILDAVFHFHIKPDQSNGWMICMQLGHGTNNPVFSFLKQNVAVSWNMAG